MSAYIERKTWESIDATGPDEHEAVIRSVIEDCAREALESVRDKDEKFAEVMWALDAAARIRALAGPGKPPK